MKKRPAQIKFKKLGDVLEAVLKKRDILFSSEKRNLQEIWMKAVGPQIAAQTSPDRMQNKCLSVKVSTPAWMQQLHFMKDEIIDKINRQTTEGFIANIYFSIGNIASQPRNHHDPEATFPAAFSLKGKDKQLIEKYTAAVSDQELKEILKRVMTKDIIRRKLKGIRRAL